MIYEYNTIISFHVGLVLSWKGSYERRIWQHVIETRKLSTRKCVQKDKTFVETYIYHCGFNAMSVNNLIICLKRKSIEKMDFKHS